MSRYYINLKFVNRMFPFGAVSHRIDWTMCLPFDFKVTRKVLAYLRRRRIKLIRDCNIKEVYANGDPIHLVGDIDENSYTLTPGYIGKKS